MTSPPPSPSSSSFDAAPAPVFAYATDLASHLAAHRDRGETVVLANGAFDLLHVGHLRCLRDAKRHGDVLVVALNRDASIQRYKDPSRPIIPEDERCEVLAAVRWVDYVCLFDEETADAIIGTLRPNFVAKGTDYDPSTLPKRTTIEAVGARIVIVGDPKNHATTDVIAKLRSLDRDLA